MRPSFVFPLILDGVTMVTEHTKQHNCQIWVGKKRWTVREGRRRFGKHASIFSERRFLHGLDYVTAGVNHIAGSYSDQRLK